MVLLHRGNNRDTTSFVDGYYSVISMSVLVSIVVSIPACHAGDRGSIPRRGGAGNLNTVNSVLVLLNCEFLSCSRNLAL